MEKIEFIYQKWFLRMFCSVILLPFFVLAQYIIFKLTGIEHENFWFDLICLTIVVFGIEFYFKYTQQHKWFIKKGTYWIEDGIVYIEIGGKTHKLRNVKCLVGTTISFFGHAKAGMLKIDSEKTITLVSSSNKNMKCFSDSEIYPLFETILEYNPELKKDDTLDFAYEIRK